MISAPPGFGATTAAAFAIADSAAVAWLGLDDLDSAPDSFWAQLVTALATLDGHEAGAAHSDA